MPTLSEPPNTLGDNAKAVLWHWFKIGVPWILGVLAIGASTLATLWLSSHYVSKEDAAGFMPKEQLRQTFVTKEDFAQAQETAAAKLTTLIAQLNADNERGRRETAQLIGGKLDDVLKTQSAMRETMIRMEEKARVDEQQNGRLTELEQRMTKTREELLSGKRPAPNP